MNLKRALAIEGFTTEKELIWLAEQASKYKVIIEIGSWLGRSATAMAENTHGIVIVVDKFHHLNDNNYGKHNQQIMINNFLENIDGINNILIAPIDHSAFSIENADMVFIDGNHEYDNVKRDIEKWLGKKNVLLCGHDFGASKWPDVARVVNELIPTYQVVTDTTIWWVQL